MEVGRTNSGASAAAARGLGAAQVSCRCRAMSIRGTMRSATLVFEMCCDGSDSLELFGPTGECWVWVNNRKLTQRRFASSFETTESPFLQAILNGPGRDRTCDLGIKSPARQHEAGCSELKDAANRQMTVAANSSERHRMETSVYAHFTRGSWLCGQRRVSSDGLGGAGAR